MAEQGGGIRDPVEGRRKQPGQRWEMELKYIYGPLRLPSPPDPGALGQFASDPLLSRPRVHGTMDSACR